LLFDSLNVVTLLKNNLIKDALFALEVWGIEAWHLEYKLGSDIYGFERGTVTY